MFTSSTEPEHVVSNHGTPKNKDRLKKKFIGRTEEKTIAGSIYKYQRRSCLNLTRLILSEA